MTNNSNPLTNFYVFIARFSDGRMKDRLWISTGDSESKSRTQIPDEWYNYDSAVYVDSLGTVTEFYENAPNLNYDFKRNPSIPNELIEIVGEDFIRTLVNVASSENGWDSMPPRAIIHDLDGETPVSHFITNDEPKSPAQSDSRTYLTDKLLWLRSRLRRVIKNDLVEYQDALQEGVERYGVELDDRGVIELLTHLHTGIQRQKTDSDSGRVLAGCLLTPYGRPEKIKLVRTDVSPRHADVRHTDTYDIVVGATTQQSRREIQWSVLNAVCRSVFRSREENYSHDWHVVEINPEDAESTTQWYEFARTESHAIQKAKRDAAVARGNSTITYHGIKDTLPGEKPIKNTETLPDGVAIDSEAVTEAVPPNRHETTVQNTLTGTPKETTQT